MYRHPSSMKPTNSNFQCHTRKNGTCFWAKSVKIFFLIWIYAQIFLNFSSHTRIPVLFTFVDTLLSKNVPKSIAFLLKPNIAASFFIPPDLIDVIYSVAMLLLYITQKEPFFARGVWFCFWALAWLWLGYSYAYTSSLSPSIFQFYKLIYCLLAFLWLNEWMKPFFAALFPASIN